MIAILTKSYNHNNYSKYVIYLFNNDGSYISKVRFGDIRYEDYLIHKNNVRKKNYINRHKKRENWDDPFKAGFWSRWLLWNKPTIEDSINDIENKYGIIIIK